jgi:hypothetical protein
VKFVGNATIVSGENREVVEFEGPIDKFKISFHIVKKQENDTE